MDYEWFKSLTDKGVFFVTRVRAKSVYKVLERKSIIPGQGITSDQIIQLNSAYAIKQNQKIKAFIGRSKNAILTQIWIAMIAYLLMSFARYSARTGWTVQRLLRVLQLNLFERRTLEQIFDPGPPRYKQNEPQMRLVM